MKFKETLVDYSRLKNCVVSENNNFGVCPKLWTPPASTNKSICVEPLFIQDVSAMQQCFRRSLSDIVRPPRGILKRNNSEGAVASVLQPRSESPTPPDSPTKNVTFADDKNLKLCEVRNYVPSTESLHEALLFFHNSPPTVRRTFSAFRTPPTSTDASLRRVPIEIVTCFSDPRNHGNFADIVRQQSVCLERCTTNKRFVQGRIVAKNIEYHKEVFVRYTLDKWKTDAEVEAVYVSNSNNGDTDTFSFTLKLPKDNKELVFAIRYCVGCREFWDNNNGANYRVRDVTFEP